MGKNKMIGAVSIALSGGLGVWGWQMHQSLAGRIYYAAKGMPTEKASICFAGAVVALVVGFIFLSKKGK